MQIKKKEEYLKTDWPQFYSKQDATLKGLSEKIQDFHVIFKACLYQKVNHLSK